ncbi:hypothetical protein E7T09_00995 [Deinococcus sp. KSM4-11]|uniref:hypothetical protein n=1 Tax=Deinococcus sp. KSM4-11 TaxID=2568654 RepID=UPI0010A57E73|nr:hypothetical protein [Deinococcus sp. KSM4-11]THF87845.1 hypothetical protein E7T09_00995 [Deinococcus sp. KSM4-11]
MRQKLLDGFERAVPTTARLRHECLWATAWTVPLWVLLQLPAATRALSPLLQALVDDGHWVMAWLLVPLCVLVVVGSCALAIWNREARDLLPYAVLALLDAVMMREIFAGLGAPPLS